MTDLTLDPRQLEAYLPHRGINLMPDTVELSADRLHAVSRTRIRAGDPRGRLVFGRRADGVDCWNEPFLGELMALTGVPLLHERLAAQGAIAVFSMISRLTFHAPVPLDAEVVGHADITRDRGAFTVFSTRAEIDGKRVLDAEVMSGVAPTSALARVADLTPAPAGEPVDAALFADRPRPMRFVDRVVEADPANGRIVAAYTYPAGHPLVPGHFPGAPVMMGVTQWAAFADTARVAVARFGLGERVVANGAIRRAAGGEILDVRDCELRIERGSARIASTKRLAFRDPVVPGESIVIEATVVRA